MDDKKKTAFLMIQSFPAYKELPQAVKGLTTNLKGD